MAENNITKNETLFHDGSEVTNWISQINAGGTVYDIATHHNITFKEGKNGAETKWNGLTDIEVVIPSITDIVQTPIEFAGTVGANGEISWNTGHSAAEVGSLVFVTADCEFAGQACEAGDMAIYDGDKWNIVSGENQVKIVGDADGNNRTTVAIGAAKDVLVVEGKALSLTLDYGDFNTHLDKSNGVVTEVIVEAEVDKTYVKLTQGEGSTVNLGADITVKEATQLKNGTVSLENAKGLVNSITKAVFTQGELPTITPNVERTFEVSGGSLTQTSEEHFVKTVSNSAVTFVSSDGTGNHISAVTGITAVSGNEFFNGIHKKVEGETADFTIDGYIAPKNGVDTKFVTGLEGDLTPVTSITEGSFKLVAGDALATGFGAAVSGKGGEVLSDVTVTANNNTSVLSSTKVSNHVLSFEPVNVTSDVSVSYMSRSLTKTGFEYTSSKATNTSFTTDGFVKVSDVDYTFGRAKETTYTTTTSKWGLNTPALSVEKGAYTLSNSGMVANVPANSFVASATPGALATYTPMSFTTTDITGSVNTELSYKDVSIHTLASDVKEIKLPGAYALDGASENGVEVGKAGALKEISAYVDLKDCITDVTVK